MMTEWIMSISPMVFTRLKTEFSEKLKKKYNMGNNNFSTKEFSGKDAIFPFVYVKQMPSQVTGTDLERSSINGMNFYFQIDVYDNQSQSRANEVMSEIIKVMIKSMRFQPKPAPSFDSTSDFYRETVRFERMIDWNDIL